MAKKKKSGKKHQFKYAAPVRTDVAVQVPRTEAKTADVSSLDVVKTDVRKVIILAGSFMVAELTLWYLFGHTGLGPAIYHLVKV